jgi:hypothetical protein
LVKLHLRGTATPSRDSCTYEVRTATPTRYGYTYAVNYTYEVQLYLRGTAILERYSYTYEIQLHLRGTLTPTLEKTNEIITEINCQSLS